MAPFPVVAEEVVEMKYMQSLSLTGLLLSLTGVIMSEFRDAPLNLELTFLFAAFVFAVVFVAKYERT